MAKIKKTNVLRQLDTQKIPYEIKTYTIEDDNFDGRLVAAKVGLDPHLIYKTLVLTGDQNDHLVCVIPVEQELDLKAAARVSGHKRVAMLPVKELFPLTGYLRGGCSPIGMKKHFPTYVDASAKALKRISVSAGMRGCQVILSVEHFMNACAGQFAPLCRE